MPEDLNAVLRAVVRDVLPHLPGVAESDLGHWRPDGSGRWSSPAALRVAAIAGMPVAHLAPRLAAGLSKGLGTAAAGGGVEVVGDGFLVVTPSPADLAAVLGTVLAAGPAYGRPARTVSPIAVNPTVPQRRTPDNALFMVMWAHARCCVALDVLAGERTTGRGPATRSERVLVLLLADLPRAIDAAGDDPAAVLRRLLEVAAATHQWLDELPAADRRASGWRAVAEATRQVLATGLDVLGLPGPSRV